MKNNFWYKAKRFLISILLIISLSPMLFLVGCFFWDEDDDGDSVSDVLYGVRLGYIKAAYENSAYKPVADEEFVKGLKQQYLDLSFEILASLVANYGKGYKNTDGLNRIKHQLEVDDYGELSIEKLFYDELLDEEEDATKYNKMLTENWKWVRETDMRPDMNPEQLIVSFCTADNISDMMLAMFLINLGVDVSKEGEGDDKLGSPMSKDDFDEYANNTEITHSSLTEDQQEILVKFILNKVIGQDVETNYENDIKQIIEDIFTQELDKTGANGEIIYKYPVVASLMVKDYLIREIAFGAEQQDKKENNEEYDGEKEPEDDNSDSFFTMRLGPQYYKSLVFMPKQHFLFQSVDLIFESTEDFNMTIFARLHYQDAKKVFFDREVAKLQIHAGSYDDLDEDGADFGFSLDEFLESEFGIKSVDENMEKYEQDTDLSCYGGLFGSGVGNLFNKYGRPLKINDDKDDVVLASLYKFEKPEFDQKSDDDLPIVKFFKEDSCFLEFLFVTDIPVPFNIGYVYFEYTIPED